MPPKATAKEMHVRSVKLDPDTHEVIETVDNPYVAATDADAIAQATDAYPDYDEHTISYRARA